VTRPFDFSGVPAHSAAVPAREWTTRCSSNAWSVSTLGADRRVVQEVIELRGPDRCTFGGNHPAGGLCTSFQTVFDGFFSRGADFGTARRTPLFVENPRRISLIPA